MIMDEYKKPGKALRIAIVANRDEKKAIVEWAYLNSRVLLGHTLLASEDTWRFLKDSLRHQPGIHKPIPYQDLGQLTERIKKGEIDHLVFFGNPIRMSNKDKSLLPLLEAAIDHDVEWVYDQQRIDHLMSELEEQRSGNATALDTQWHPISGTDGKESLRSKPQPARIIQMLTRKIALLF